MAGSINQTVIRLKDYFVYIEEISFTLEQILEGNLDYYLFFSYTENFRKIKQASKFLSISLSKILYKIRIAVDKVK